MKCIDTEYYELLAEYMRTYKTHTTTSDEHRLIMVRYALYLLEQWAASRGTELVGVSRQNHHTTRLT